MLLGKIVLGFLTIHAGLLGRGYFLRVPSETRDSGFINCGPYGFRCLDLETFQLCTFLNSDDTTEAPQPTYECKEGYICDENNQAYCTSVAYGSTLYSNREQAPPIPQVGESKRQRKDKLFDRYFSSNFNGQTSLESQAPTTEPETVMRGIKAVPEFDCDVLGVFPDYWNNTLFWYCDVGSNGVGFVARHMMCERDKIFDPFKGTCIIPELERSLRTDDLSSCKKIDPCKDRSPGRYADKSDCRFYSVCPGSLLTVYNRFSCPDNTAFDPITQKCTHSALQECNNNYCMKQAIIIKSPIYATTLNCAAAFRFRDITNCYGYYACQNHQLLEMRCPPFYKFDDNAFDCVPEENAECSVL